MASPKTKKGAQLAPEILDKMDGATALLFSLAEPQMEYILARYIEQAQKSGNEDMLINLVDRLVGKSAPRVQPEANNTVTLNILTHGGDMESYRLASPGQPKDAIDVEYDNAD